MKWQWRSFLVAVQFLTRLPVPAQRSFEPTQLARSTRYFPAVGVLVGVINVGVWAMARRWLPAGVSVGLMLSASLLVTGAFHEDGFADSCDGFGGGTSRERVLEIMKDSRVGAYGAIGIFMMLGLKWITLLETPAVALPILVVSAHMMSRWCATALIWRLRYVRSDTSAKGTPLSGSLTFVGWIGSGAVGMAAAGACLLAAGYRTEPPEALALLIGSVAAGCTAAVAAVYCRQRIGGYTGDCLGAVQQLSELAFLIVGLGALRFE